MKNAANVMFTQMQAKRGFHLFGVHAVDDMIKEFKNWKKELSQGKKL